MKEKISIDERYFKKDEIRTNTKPYEAYYNCLSSTFNLNEIKSICDAGCANGPLMYEIKKNNNNIELLGIEYFQWQKDASDELIKKDIVVHDLRDEFVTNKKYDIVNCTETGEHIDPSYAGVCGKYLIISWSDTGGINDVEHDEHVQHLNPLNNNQVNELLTKHGFRKNNELTNKFVNYSIGNNDFNFWWRKSLGVWEMG